MIAQPALQHDDVLALQEILGLVEQSVGHYNAIASEVRNHLDRIATERAALGALRTRLVGMHGAVKGWHDRVWDLGWRQGVTHQARTDAKGRIHTYERLLDELVWQLFDFREHEGEQT